MLTLLVGACGGGLGGIGGSVTEKRDQPNKNSGVVKVALLLPLTGNPSAQGVARAMKQAGELALFEFNKPNVQLIPKDTRGTPDGARAAAADAIKDGAQLIVGPLFAGEVTAAAPVARAEKVPILAFSSDRSVAGNGVYLLSFVPGGEAQRVVSYAQSKGKSRFAGLFPQNDYGRLVEQAFRQAVQSNGGQLVLTKNYPVEVNGMLPPVREIAALAKKGSAPQIDALFVAGGPDTLPSLAPMLTYADVDPQAIKVLGSTQWDYPPSGKETAFTGGWFAAPDPKGWQDFQKRYNETYGETPPRLASLAYDAISLAISLTSSGGGFTATELTRPTGFAGIDGLFRLRPDGTSERGFAILEAGRTENRVIDPAPAAFSSTVAQY